MFLHHRVLIVPIATAGRVHALVTRNDFFRALAGKLGDPNDEELGASRPLRRRRDAGGADQAALVQQLGELDGVGGRALAQVVAHDPEVEAALVRGVAAYAPDEHVVAARAAVASG